MTKNELIYKASGWTWAAMAPERMPYIDELKDLVRYKCKADAAWVMAAYYLLRWLLEK